MFQVLVIPLRQLYLRYTRKPIPSTRWTSELLDLFEFLKVAITSSPVLARYDSSLPTFLKTDWSDVGIGFIIMQPTNDKMSLDSGRGIRGDTTIREFEDRGSKYMSMDTQGHSNIQDDRL